DNTVSRLDPATGTATTVATGHRASGAIAAGEGRVWVASQDGVLSRIDAASGRASAAVEVGSPDWPALVVVGGAVWLSAPLDGLAVRVDAARGAVAATLHAGARPQGLALDGGRLWVADHDGGVLLALAA